MIWAQIIFLQGDLRNGVFGMLGMRILRYGVSCFLPDRRDKTGGKGHSLIVYILEHQETNDFDNGAGGHSGFSSSTVDDALGRSSLLWGELLEVQTCWREEQMTLYCCAPGGL